MKRNLMLVVLAGAMLLFVQGCCKHCKKHHHAGMDGQAGNIARLTGEQEVPPVMTKAHGQFTLENRVTVSEVHRRIVINGLIPVAEFTAIWK